jgi:predicted enzyme related to lactoylglutathione lyase
MINKIALSYGKISNSRPGTRLDTLRGDIGHRYLENPAHQLAFSCDSRPMPAPRLYRTILPVTDIEQAAAFYAAVLGIPGQRVSPGRHYFHCGGTILACYDPVADGDGDNDDWHFHPHQYLYFAVADLENVLARIESAGGTIDRPIETMPWGERLFYARDPSGTRISFVDERTLFTG